MMGQFALKKSISSEQLEDCGQIAYLVSRTRVVHYPKWGIEVFVRTVSGYHSIIIIVSTMIMYECTIGLYEDETTIDRCSLVYILT